MRLSKKAKRRVIVLASVLALAVIGVVGVKAIRAQQQRRLVAEARQEGLQAYERGDLQNALDELKYYVQHKKNEPEVIEILLKFADARRHLPLPNGQHLVEAMGYYHHARKLLNAHPALPDHGTLLQTTRSRLLELYGALGMRVELLQTADRILQGDPDDPEALVARTRALYLDREFDDALASAEALVAVEGDDPSWRHLQLQIMQGLKRPEEELLAQCDKWIADWEGDGRLHLLKAGWLAEMGRIDEARDVAAIAAEQGADTLEILQQMVSLLDLLQMPQVASQVLSEARSRFPAEQWVPEATVRRSWQAGRLDAALAEIDRAQGAVDALQPGLLRLKVVVLISAERFDEARQALAALQQAAGEGDVGRADRAWSAALQARLDLTEETWRGAIEAYQLALTIEPDDAVLHFLLGEAYGLMGEHALAADAQQRAFSLQPNWLAAGAALADSLLAGGRPHEAFQTSRTLMTRAADGRLSMYLLLARSYLASLQAGGDPVMVDSATSRPIDIVGLLTAIGEQFPQQAQVPVLLAEACCLTGRLRQAGDVMQEALSAEEPDADVLLSLVQISRRYGLHMESELFARARQLEGLTIRLAFVKADLLAEQERAGEGLALIDQAIKAASPEEREAPQTRRARCAYLLRIGHEDALASLAALVEDPSQPVDALLFALWQPQAWDDPEFVAPIITRLKDLMGEHAPQVRLAEANALLRFHGEDESRRAKAIVMIGDVLERCPDSLPGLILMAQASLAGEHPSVERAVAHLQRAVNVAPARSELLVQLIALLQRQGEYEAADRYLRHLSRLAEHDPGALRSEMRLLHAQGDFEGALLRFGGIVDQTSPISDQLVLAALHARAGDDEAAAQIYERLLAKADRDELVVAQAAEFYANTGRFDRAVSLLEQVDGEDGIRATLLGTFFQRHGRFAEAERWLNEAVQTAPQSVEARHQLARLYLAASEPDEARRQALAGLRIDPRHTGLRATLATANMGPDAAGRRQAIELLRELGEANDSLLATLTLLEKVPVKDGRTSPTEENLAQAKRLTELHPQFLPAWLLAVTLHREAGRMRETIDLARRAVSRFPAHAEPAEWTTRLLVDAQRWDEALMEGREWRRRSLDSPVTADLVLASILLQLRRPADALQTLAPYAERFNAERETAPDRLVLWLTALLRSGDVGGAWQTVRPLLAEDDRWRTLWIGFTRLTEYDQSREMLTWLEPIVSGDGSRAVLELAQGWSSLGWRFDRIECFERAAELAGDEPADPAQRAAWLFLRGRIAEGRGDLSEAERLYHAVLLEEPRSAAALNNLAYVLAQAPDRCAEALGYAEQALGQEPDQPDLLDTYARALLGLGRTGEARSALETAILKRPDDIELNLSLAELLIETEQFGEAGEALQIARRELGILAAAEPALETRANAVEQRLRHALAQVEP